LLTGIILLSAVPEPAEAAPVPPHPVVHMVITKQYHAAGQVPARLDPKHVEVDKVPIPSPPPIVAPVIRAPQQPPEQRWHPRSRIIPSAVIMAP